MSQPLERTVLRQAKSSFQSGDRVVVGFSGGPDSTALLAALCQARGELGFELVAAHLDHGLRSPEVAGWEREAAKATADWLGVPFVAARADARAEAEARRTGSLEAAARAVRYRFFAEVASAEGANWLALGHTADDQAETVLLRLLRGTGLTGLAGMPAIRQLSGGVSLVRPLLGLARGEVLEYLSRRGLSYVEDPSNSQDRFTRNRVRNEVLPLLRERINPRVDDALLRVARQARLASDHFVKEADALLERARCGDGWNVEALLAADSAVLAEALATVVRQQAPDRTSERHVRALEAVVRGGHGAVQVPGGARFEVSAGALTLGEVPELAVATGSQLELPIPGEVLDGLAGMRFTARVLPAQEVDDLNVDPRRRALLDARLVTEPLGVRRRRQGDRFWPLGGPGRRSLKRFFNDRKVPRAERDEVPIVTLADRPLWIVGHRIDERFKVTPDTARVLEIRASAVQGEMGGRS